MGINAYHDKLILYFIDNQHKSLKHNKMHLTILIKIPHHMLRRFLSYSGQVQFDRQYFGQIYIQLFHSIEDYHIF